jgi:predicted nuclease of predicted toxin-antitoxin system
MQNAHQEKRIILTYDKDFGELAVKDPIYPSSGIILFRLSQKNPGLIAKYIGEVIKSRQDWEGHFSVVESERIRMRPLLQ